MRQTSASANYGRSPYNHTIGRKVGSVVAASLCISPLAACDAGGQCVPGTAHFTQQSQHEYILYDDELATLSKDYLNHTSSQPLDSTSGQALQADLALPRSKNIRVRLYIPLGQPNAITTPTTEADNAAHQLADSAGVTGDNLIVVLPTEVDPVKQTTTLATVRVTSGTC